MTGQHGNTKGAALTLLNLLARLAIEDRAATDADSRTYGRHAATTASELGFDGVPAVATADPRLSHGVGGGSDSTHHTLGDTDIRSVASPERQRHRTSRFGGHRVSD